jgi:dTDP-4-amino-4,6-dideoxygalactose transaminase
MKLKVPLLDLTEQYKGIREDVMLAIEEVVDSQRFILGPKVEALEKGIADYCWCKYAVGVSSGTDALLISLMTAEVGHGDLVITSPYTFFATAGVIARVGAKPVFVDIDKKTYNIDPVKLEETIFSMSEEDKNRLKAIIPVHLFGQCADMQKIMSVADTYKLTVIEDAAQAIGSEYEFADGSVTRAGSIGQYGCFSFFPSKNLGGFGDGGMVTTNDEETYNRLKRQRTHGADPKYYHDVIGGNFRLDALQAAILLVKLASLDKWTSNRIQNANNYKKFFVEEGIDEALLPQETEKKHVYNQFVIKVKDKRDELRTFLNENGIGSEIYYPVPLHMQRCFSYLGYKSEDFPESLSAAEKTLALPVYPEMGLAKIKYIVDIIKKFFRN